MNIDDLIKELRELRKQGAERVYFHDRFHSHAVSRVSSVDRDQQGDALIR